MSLTHAPFLAMAVTSIDVLAANPGCTKDDVTPPCVFDVHKTHFQLIRLDQSAVGGHSKSH